jgi:hypothetical protein
MDEGISPQTFAATTSADGSADLKAAAEEGVKSSQERKELLARAISSEVAAGARVESQGDFQAVVVHGKPVNHILHLILTIVTLGLWVLVWIALAIVGGEKRSMVTVDPYGNTAVVKV